MIDALRGAAALAVFVFHVSMVAGFPKRTLPPFTLAGRTFTSVLSPLSLGASGVHLFFIISGFCLALQQWRSPDPTLGPDLRRYAQNRVARIAPAYWLTVLLAAALVIATGAAAQIPLVRDTALHLLFLHGFDPGAFLSMHGGLWSMATEVQFYAAFPLLLILFARLGTPAALAAIVSANLIFRLGIAYLPWFASPHGAPWAPTLAYQLPGRAAEFALGMALAHLYLRRTPEARARWARLCALSLVPTVPLALLIRAFGPSFLPDLALGGMYFLLCAALILPVRRATPSPLLELCARFGRASYSFFLIHYLVLLIIDSAQRGPADPWSRFALLSLLGLPLSSLGAVAMYLGIELPLWQRLRA